MGARPYFAFGLNMDRHDMAGRCPRSRWRGAVVLSGYRFRINPLGVATVVPDRNARVYGVLWDLDRDDERSLDWFEGVSIRQYRKSLVQVRDLEAGRRCSALVYLTCDSRPGVAGRGYMERVLAAAEAAGLPERYRRHLSRWRRGFAGVRKKEGARA